MIFYPREHKNCGCAWTDSSDSLCDRCRRIREDEDAAQQVKEAYEDQ